MNDVTTFGGNELLVAALTRAGTRFLVVGGAALRWHIPERPIGSNDLDLLIESTVANATKVISALRSIGLTGPELTPERLAQPRSTQVPLKGGVMWADIITNPELPFQEHWDHAADAKLFGFPVKVASLETLQGLLASSPEPKHAVDRALVESSLSRGAAQ